MQGQKRAKVAGGDFIGYLDPAIDVAQYKKISDLIGVDYDAVAICTPNFAKEDYIDYFIEQEKNVLVEKPLLCKSLDNLLLLRNKAKTRQLVLYTAYNHRFEPSISFLKERIRSEQLGKIYFVRLIYGNGTARLVKNSSWRDTGLGVIEDLVPHLLDTLFYWFPDSSLGFSLVNASNFENRAPDHGILVSQNSRMLVSLEVSLCAWRNTFICDIYGEKGSAHINGLCKWGDSEVKLRKRVLPSGVPIEESLVFPSGDPTWKLEYEHFKDLVQNNSYQDVGVDLEIQTTLDGLSEFIEP